MISCKNLSKGFDEKGIRVLSFQVEKGQTLGILGPAGAGKSLTLRILMGQLRADAGSATIFGKDCWFKRHEIQASLAFAPAVPALETRATGEQYLRFSASYNGGFNPQKARDLTERLDIALTGAVRGMTPEARKKLSLLAALSLDRDVLLLDEPFNGLSPMAKNALGDVIREETRKGRAILMTSHVLDEVRRACTHIAIIRKGQLVVNQPVESLNLTRQKVYHITFETPDQAASFAGEWESAVELIGARALVAIPASPQVLLQTLARYSVLDLIGGREEAEEGFLRFHGDDIV
jgi:ABC-2 type transport system ATP-binding protein